LQEMPPPIETPPDNPKGRLRFWREAKEHVAKLSARISQLREITQSTADRLRIHGTAETHDSQPTPSRDILTLLEGYFRKLKAEINQIQVYATALQLGPGGPLDPEYSREWIEAQITAHEQREFEATAVKMGYKPNSVTLDPVFTEAQKTKLKTFNARVTEELARTAVGGEYIEARPGDGMDWLLEKAGRLASRAGLDEFQRGQRVYMLAQTFAGRGISMEDPVEMAGLEEAEGEENKGAEEAEAEEVETEEVEAEEVEAKEVEAEEGEENNEVDEKKEENVEESVKVKPLFAGHDVTPPVTIDSSVHVQTEDSSIPTDLPDLWPQAPEPRKERSAKLPANYTSLMHLLRESMVDVDKDVTALEDTWDEFLKKTTPKGLPKEDNKGVSV
jgi:hypothetical protein